MKDPFDDKTGMRRYIKRSLGGGEKDLLRLRQLASASGYSTRGPLSDPQVRRQIAKLRAIGRLPAESEDEARLELRVAATAVIAAPLEAPVAPLPPKKSEPSKEEEKFKVVEATPVEVTAGTSE